MAQSQSAEHGRVGRREANSERPSDEHTEHGRRTTRKYTEMVQKNVFFLVAILASKKKTYYGYVGQLFAVHVSSTMALGSMILEHYFQDVRN